MASLKPRTFFLNETHELARGERESGGRLPRLADVDWESRAQQISLSLAKARDVVDESRDPLRRRRYFLATVPNEKIRKLSGDKRRAPRGIVEEETDYAGEHSSVFRRLGLDLLAVDRKGRALVHAWPSRVEQLLSTASTLPDVGPRERARWITIDSFVEAPATFRLDEEWLEPLPEGSILDAVIELQPLLSRIEVDEVIRAVVGFAQAQGQRIPFERAGVDFSGRRWYRGSFARETLRQIADEFFSVQSLHPPLQTEVAAIRSSKNPSEQPASTSVGSGSEVGLLPVVAVVDVGVPRDHRILASYRRGSYVGLGTPTGIQTEHASRVASRVVFGEQDYAAGIEAEGTCAFYDVNVAEDAFRIDDKSVVEALQAVVGTSPDVRVFNLSFGEYEALDSFRDVERSEKLLLLQDLDNFIFRSDILVVVAAGNSRPGVIPSPAYPNHIEDPRWALGSWACGFNSLTCGSYVGRLNPEGLVRSRGWPSPFTRVGFGLCKAPTPEFSADGGNCTADFRWAPGLGVWTCNASGLWEDSIGTSYAAPLLAREAAFVMRSLQARCEEGARPFASTVKAFLALTAEPPPEMPERVRPLAARTLGRGTGRSDRLVSANAHSAVIVWQGVLEGPEDMARISVPIPRDWLGKAAKPILRVILAWESPVNAAVEHRWSCRRVEVQLRPGIGGKAVRGRSSSHRSYPLLDRSYLLDSATLAKQSVTPPASDNWLLEISYREIAEYIATIEFSPHHRVGVAMEVLDADDEPVSPQSAMQALPAALLMNRLTVPENRVPNPVVVRTKIRGGI